jgi:hypothetical protein
MLVGSVTYKHEFYNGNWIYLPIQNGVKQEDILSSLFLNFDLEYAVNKVQEKPGGTEIEWNTSASGLC